MSRRQQVRGVWKLIANLVGFFFLRPASTHALTLHQHSLILFWSIAIWKCHTHTPLPLLPHSQHTPIHPENVKIHWKWMNAPTCTMHAGMFCNFWYCMIMGTLMLWQKEIGHADWFIEQEQKNNRIREPWTQAAGLLCSFLKLVKNAKWEVELLEVWVSVHLCMCLVGIACEQVCYSYFIMQASVSEGKSCPSS